MTNLMCAYLKQNKIFKAREGKYQTKLNAVETLAAGATEENEVFSLLMHLDAYVTVLYYYCLLI